MDLSEEKPERPNPTPQKKFSVLPAILIILLLLAIGGILFFFNSSSIPPLVISEQEQTEEGHTAIDREQKFDTEKSASLDLKSTDPAAKHFPLDTREPQADEDNGEEQKYDISAPSEEPPPPPVLPEDSVEVSVCTQPEQRLRAFYAHLDTQPYMKAYHLSTSSQDHFIALIKKLLDNPPEVSRESDDLYTILKNTAHFFRISGKDNIFMLQGILNSEKDQLEQILADYYLLVTIPECSSSPYTDTINRDALYEYACFFLNTMGGRLYLFRRDSLSRMTVTYYAILLVELANTQQNNRHGIALTTGVNMLISEMERGGSSLKGIEEYLDKLYDLKEKYQ